MPNSPDFKFKTRDRCPACSARETRTRFSCRFDEPPISTFLADYYAIDPSILDGTYRIEQCANCGTYFQAEVGNPALLEQLYSKWVADVSDPMLDSNYAYDLTHPRQSRDGH